MNQSDQAALENYPHGRGYGHDYMRGGEVLGGYGYAERDEYSRGRGEIYGDEQQLASADQSGHPPDVRT
ncbi:MAG: hypothetical protein ACREPM_03805 [Gemmatimonadaceae bacterium]